MDRAYQVYRTQQSHVERIQDDLLGRADTALEVTRQSYQEGEASLIDYLDALRVRLDTSLCYYELLFQFAKSPHTTGAGHSNRPTMIRPGGSRTSFHLFCVPLSFFLISGSCRTEDPGGEGDEAETVTVTVWTDSFELFLEYPQVRVGEPVHFAAHLTDLNTFNPVRMGPVAFQFLENQELLQEVILEEPLRPGIVCPGAHF